MTDETVTLRPMTAEQYSEFMDAHLSRYEQEIIDTGARPEAARKKATDDLARALPNGRESPGQALFAAYVGDVAIGSLWLGLADSDQAWIYYVLVDEAYRGRGYGRTLMTAAEDECRSRGVHALGLNVFGGNTTARRLYESMGYAVSAQQMRKGLAAG